MYQRFIKIRKDLKMTQEVFAETIGLSRTGLAMIEIGKANPTLETVVNIYNKYGINPTWLIIGSGKIKNIDYNLNEVNDPQAAYGMSNIEVINMQRDLIEFQKKQIKEISDKLEECRKSKIP